jgi:hypothetical protein
MPTFIGPVDDDGNITVPAEGGAIIPIKEQSNAEPPIQLDISALPFRFFVKGRIDKTLSVDPNDSLGKVLEITETEAENLSESWHPFQLIDESNITVPTVVWAGKIRRSEILESVQEVDSGNIFITYGSSTIIIQRDGIPGLNGQDGADGAPGGITYQFNQNSPSTSWAIPHNLGRFPSVTVVDSLGREVIGDVVFQDSNFITIDFNVPLSGTAYLN